MLHLSDRPLLGHKVDRGICEMADSADCIPIFLFMSDAVNSNTNVRLRADMQLSTLIYRAFALNMEPAAFSSPQIRP